MGQLEELTSTTRLPAHQMRAAIRSTKAASQNHMLIYRSSNPVLDEVVWRLTPLAVEQCRRRIRRGDEGKCRANPRRMDDRLRRKRDEADCLNPMFGAVCYPLESGEPVRRRKICCLRYLLPGDEGCGSLCPLLKVRTQTL